MSDAETPAPAKDERGVPLLETIATVVAAVLLAAVVAVLVRDAVRDHSRAVFKTTTRSVERTATTLRSGIDVANIGDEAAKTVVVHVELLAADKDSAVDETDIEVDWLPGNSRRSLDALFAIEPKTSVRVRASVRGYVVP